MTPREWRAFTRHHEQAEERIDLRIALVRHTFAAANLKHEDGSKIELQEFLPDKLRARLGSVPRGTPYNGHQDPAKAMAEVKAAVMAKGLGRELAPGDPRARVDSKEIAAFMEAQRG